MYFKKWFYPKGKHWELLTYILVSSNNLDLQDTQCMYISKFLSLTSCIRACGKWVMKICPATKNTTFTVLINYTYCTTLN